MICPNCNSKNITLQSVEPKTPSKVESKSSSKGCLYWLFIGWWWEPFYLFFIKIPITVIQWFIDLLTSTSTEIDQIAKCQTCGYSWKYVPKNLSSSPKRKASEGTNSINNKIILIVIGGIIGLCLLSIAYSISVQSLRSWGLLPTPIFTPTSTATITPLPTFPMPITNTHEPTNTTTVTKTPAPTNTATVTKTPAPTNTPKPLSLEEQIYRALIEPLGRNTIYRVIISDDTLQVNTNLDRENGVVAFYSEIGVIHGVIVRANPSVDKVILNDVTGQRITMPMEAMIRYYQKFISWDEFRDTWEITEGN